MKKIEVTMEKRQRVAHMFEIPDSVYEEIKRTREIPTDMFERMEEILDDSSADTEYDYAVWSETEQKQLIELEKIMYRYTVDCNGCRGGGLVKADSLDEAREKIMKYYDADDEDELLVWAWENDDYYDPKHPDVYDCY